MKKLSYKISQLVIISFVIITFQACSIKIPVDSPSTSDTSYQNINSNNNIETKFESRLSKEHSVAAGDRKNVFILEHKNKKINANSYIKSALTKELSARKVSLNFSNANNNKLILEDFEIITHRVSGFSPLVTVSTLKLKLNIGTETKTLISMVKRAKVPVWSMNEINEPCYNEATSILIKEVVAKINKNYFGHKFSDEYIQELQSKISNNSNNKLTYLDVYELGFSNNLKSLEFIKQLTKSKDEYIRLAAISSIGILGDIKQYDFLVSLNTQSELWQDRAMALKSIGDLDTSEGFAYLKERKNFWQGKTTKEAIWNLKIINLYLN